MGRQVQGVCFDLGGVLVQIRSGFVDACAAAGVFLHRAVHVEAAFANAQPLVDDYQRGRLDWPEFADHLSRALGNGCTGEDVAKIHDAWMQGVFPGAAAVLDRVEALGLKTALLSNTNARHWARLEEFPLVRRIEYRFASHLTGRLKPEPEAYSEVERALGCEGPEILFFDDLRLNVEAALQRGWRAVQIRAEADPAAQILATLLEAVDNDAGVGIEAQETARTIGP